MYPLNQVNDFKLCFTFAQTKDRAPNAINQNIVPRIVYDTVGQFQPFLADVFNSNSIMIMDCKIQNSAQKDNPSIKMEFLSTNDAREK